MTPDEHHKHLQGFETDRLLKILALEAAKNFNGCYAILASADGYRIAFGWPNTETGAGTKQIARMPVHPTLKAALREALVGQHYFYHYGTEVAAAYWDALGEDMDRERAYPGRFRHLPACGLPGGLGCRRLCTMQCFKPLSHSQYNVTEPEAARLLASGKRTDDTGAPL